MQEREITTRIRRDELQGLLLDTQEPTAQQRITAPMPAVTLELLLQPEEPPPSAVQVTFRRAARGTNVSAAGLGAADDFDEDVATSDISVDRETTPLPIRDTVRHAAAVAAGLGTIDGIPVQVAGVDSSIIAAGSSPSIRPSAIEAAIDAAVDAEIHYAEIEAAIDAVVLPAIVAKPQRFGVVALSFALSFVAGMVIMFLLS